MSPKALRIKQLEIQLHITRTAISIAEKKLNNREISTSQYLKLYNMEIEIVKTLNKLES